MKVSGVAGEDFRCLPPRGDVHHPARGTLQDIRSTDGKAGARMGKEVEWPIKRYPMPPRPVRLLLPSPLGRGTWGEGRPA